ncbi:hypothetical protein [Azospirillum sp. sgz302134]
MEAALSREHTLADGDVLTYRVAFQRHIGQWVISMACNGQPAWVLGRDHVLADIAGELGAYIWDLERCIEHEAEVKDAEQAKLEEEAYHLQQLEKIGGLTDDGLIRGYEDAVVEDMRTSDCFQEWGWHPAYTGPDDPGLGYYQEQSRLAGEIRDAYESEMKRRGLYEAHHNAVFDRVMERRGYNDEPVGNYYPPAK